MKHAARIPVSETLLLEWLLLEGGNIKAIVPARFGVWEFEIEHEDLPEVLEGASLQEISIVTTSTYAECGHVASVVRTSPSQRVKEEALGKGG